MKTDKEFVSEALRQVWAWKAAIYQDVKHLSVRDALHAIVEQANLAAEQMGFPVQPRGVPPCSLAADKHASYNSRTTLASHQQQTKNRKTPAVRDL